MDDQLLVRTYNVGLGDCIYVRVPDVDQHRHILIDCGNTHGDELLLGNAIRHLAAELAADETGNHALDLLVVTHPHQDHIAGFGVHTDEFLKLEIRNLWLSASMNPQHRHAGKTLRLQAFADEIVEEFTRLPLGPALHDFALELFGLSNKPALDALRVGLPEKNKLPENQPTYVHDAAELPSILADDEAGLQVLGPREDIDGEYLGKLDEALGQFLGLAGMKESTAAADFAASFEADKHRPRNVSVRDFRRLRSRLFKNALAFVLGNSELVNNTSVVLLLEWHGRRLLFTGDSQFRESRRGEYQQGKRNGGWNVMWHYHRKQLDQPVDFLKVGHHGSHNATPFVADEPEHPINRILDALVPAGGDHRTEVVVSTERMKYPSIPDRALLTELGRRVETRRKYDEPRHLDGRMLGKTWDKYDADEELVPPQVVQPLRTDLEHQQTGAAVPFIDRKFSRKD